MSKEKGKIPMAAGLYYAKSGDFKWYNLIVEVRGEAPFFKCIAWNRGLHEGLGEIDVDDISFWGPMIPEAVTLE